jgi:hypothetical protein
MQERRVETRYLCSDLVRLLWSEEPQRERDETVVLENISASGACVQVTPEHLLDPGEIKPRRPKPLVMCGEMCAP